jgi:hypothetical protein
MPRAKPTRAPENFLGTTFVDTRAVDSKRLSELLRSVGIRPLIGHTMGSPIQRLHISSEISNLKDPRIRSLQDVALLSLQERTKIRLSAETRYAARRAEPVVPDVPGWRQADVEQQQARFDALTGVRDDDEQEEFEELQEEEEVEELEESEALREETGPLQIPLVTPSPGMGTTVPVSQVFTLDYRIPATIPPSPVIRSSPIIQLSAAAAPTVSSAAAAPTVSSSSPAPTAPIPRLAGFSQEPPVQTPPFAPPYSDASSIGPTPYTPPTPRQFTQMPPPPIPASMSVPALGPADVPVNPHRSILSKPESPRFSPAIPAEFSFSPADPERRSPSLSRKSKRNLTPPTPGAGAGAGADDDSDGDGFRKPLGGGDAGKGHIPATFESFGVDEDEEAKLDKEINDLSIDLDGFEVPPRDPYKTEDEEVEGVLSVKRGQSTKDVLVQSAIRNWNDKWVIPFEFKKYVISSGLIRNFTKQSQQLPEGMFYAKYDAKKPTGVRAWGYFLPPFQRAKDGSIRVNPDYFNA